MPENVKVLELQDALRTELPSLLMRIEALTGVKKLDLVLCAHQEKSDQGGCRIAVVMVGDGGEGMIVHTLVGALQIALTEQPIAIESLSRSDLERAARGH